MGEFRNEAGDTRSIAIAPVVWTQGVKAMHRLTAVRTPQDLATIRMLFGEYVDGLGIDLSFQGFAAELAALPGKYAPPSGDLLLASDADGTALGCVGMRPLDIAGACEVKRLYVRDSARGRGLGRALAEAAIAFASAAGYRLVMLDTLGTMAAAAALYRSLGFVPVPPYGPNVVPGMLFFARPL